MAKGANKSSPKPKKKKWKRPSRQKNPVYLIGLPNIIRPPPRCQRLNCPKFNEEKTETRLSTTFNYRESFALSRSNEWTTGISLFVKLSGILGLLAIAIPQLSIIKKGAEHWRHQAALASNHRVRKGGRDNIVTLPSFLFCSPILCCNSPELGRWRQRSRADSARQSRHANWTLSHLVRSFIHELFSSSQAQKLWSSPSYTVHFLFISNSAVYSTVFRKEI